jgi:ketosteroid isomerase-like protein
MEPGLPTSTHTEPAPTRAIGRVDLVREALEAFQRRDLEAMLELVHPRFTFFAPTALIAPRPYSDLYRGADGLRDYFRDVASVWDELHITPQEFRAGQEAIVALGTVNGRTRWGDVHRHPVAWACRFRDGRIVWARVYRNQGDALADMGL